MRIVLNACRGLTVAAGLNAVLAATPAAAQATPQPAPLAPGFRIDQWTTDDGLPSHSITGIAQTSDGYLWIATPGGLARFDGFSFTVYTSANVAEFPSSRVRSVFAGKGDTLWVALEQHGVFAMTGGVVHRVMEDSRGIAHLAQDAAGRLYGGGYQTLFRFDASGRHTIGVTRPVPLTYAPFPQAAVDSAGTMWVLGDFGRALYRVTDAGLVRGPDSFNPAIVTAPSTREVFSVRFAAGGGQVVDASGAVRGAYAAKGGSAARLIDEFGALWVTTTDGVEVYAPGRPAPVARFVLPRPTTAIVLTEDREGNIWVGTAQQGLWRIQRTAFSVVGRPGGFDQEQVTSLWRADGGLVFASDPLNHVFRAGALGGRTNESVTGDRAERLALRAPIVPATIGAANVGNGAAYVDRRGTLWFGWGRRNGFGFLIGRRAGQPDIVIGNSRTPARIVEDSNRAGTIWYYDGAQVYRAQPYGPLGARIDKTWGTGGLLRDIAIDRSGAAWLPGVETGGRARLIRIANDSLRRFTVSDGLPPNELRAVVVDRDDVVWIGTYGMGIYRFKDGRFQGVTARNGLAEDVVSAILVDDADNFWMSGNRGVHRVSRAELNAFLDGKAASVHGVMYTRRDGLLNPEASGWNAVRAGDGRMWFPTYDGAAVVDPVAALSLDARPPLVRVERVLVNGDSVPIARAGRLALGRRRLDIAFTGISLRNPAGVRFQYRMDGIDTGWVDAGASRSAVYNSVGPGTYAFRVRAMNGGAVWSSASAPLAVGVPRYFYETAWFFAAVALTIAGLAYGGHRYRVRDLEHRREALNAIVEERTAALAEEKQRTESTLRMVSAQAEQLQSVDKTKSRFFANVSHEFRTPLSLILGPLEDIRDGRAGAVADAAQRKLDTVIGNARRLVRLVDQLLDIARLEGGALHLRADVHDLVAYLRRTAESFSSHAERRDISFVVSCPVGGIRVRFDSEQMDKVLANLLGNAFKFTKSGGRVELHAETEGAWAVVRVIDTGDGIPADHLPRVFDRFYQVDDSARREHEGAGIGLALTKELVELHGGQIGAASTLGHGSTFTVRLPLATAGDVTPVDAQFAMRNVGAESPPGEVAAYNGAPDSDGTAQADVTTVLLVEDNAELLAYLREHLESKYRVLEATNGVDALDMARALVPDLIVSDVMMPRMDGQALCEAIKSDVEIDFIPVILLTAKASRENRLAGLATGADDYLTKPVDMRELLVRAENLITSRRRLRERFREEQRTLPTLTLPFAAAAFDTDSDAFVRKLYDVFAKHVGAEELQADTLAQELSMSRRTLYRHTETVLGCSPMDALRDYRLDQAAQWLRETDAFVSEVAYGVGFKSLPHFCTRFRTRFGVTPSAYRASRGASRAGTPGRRP